MTLNDIKTYYSNLLIMQYKDKPKARGEIAIAAESKYLNGLILQEMSCFDLDTAVGEQLDILGNIIGVPRDIKGLDIGTDYVVLARYDDSLTASGFARYVDIDYIQGHLARYYVNGAYSMSDAQMRSVMKFKIIQNTCRVSTKNLVEYMWSYFGNGILLTDNKDMTMGVAVTSTYKDAYIIADFINFFPTPLGVTRIVTYV